MNSVYVYPWDLVDEGVAEVLARLAQAGARVAKVACVYHSGKLLLTRNPARRVFFPEDGAAYFRPGSGFLNCSPLTPPVSRFCATEDLLDAICAEAPLHGLAVDAWAVCLHNRALAAARPDLCTVNAYGDVYPHSLCPLQPDVREYLRALVTELAARPVRRIILEAIGFVPFRHYSYCEVEGVNVGGRENLLLSLCFCSSCARAFPEAAAVRPFVRTQLDEFLHSGVPDQGTNTSPPELAGLLSARAKAVSELVRLLSAAAAEQGKTLSVIAAGGPYDEVTGIDLSEIGKTAGAIDFAYYCAEPGGLSSQLARVRSVLPPQCGVDLLLRPGYPDTVCLEDIEAKLASAREAGVRDFSFYNYGLLSAQAFERLTHAMSR